jgi:hypothetical protein
MRWNLLGRALIPIGILVGAACASNPNAQPGATSVASSAQGISPSQTPGVGTQASPVPVANLQVSPPDVSVGGVSLSLAFEAARHMEDETRALAVGAQPQPAAPQPTLIAGPPAQGAIVLSDMLHVTNNLDPSQPVPPDSAQAIVRQAVVQVMATDTHQMVPYLTVTMDLLLDGRPVTFGQTLVPIVVSDTSGQRVYYGNNVRLPDRGAFQVFIRLNRTPLLGQDTPPAAQFNLNVK